jgi:hypothetical protein
VSERLGPPPSPLPERRPGDELLLPSGSTFGRIFSAGGSHPTVWNHFRHFGPVPSMRFDHHPPPPRDHRTRSISYLAPSRQRRKMRNDPLEACIREVFADTGLIDVHTNAPWFVLWDSTRDLRLLDVNDSKWIARAGGNGAISTGARGPSRNWSRAIHRNYRNVDGIYYATSSLPMSRSVALYERARNALPARFTLCLPLAHPGFRPALQRIAVDYDMDLIP